MNFSKTFADKSLELSKPAPKEPVRVEWYHNTIDLVLIAIGTFIFMWLLFQLQSCAIHSIAQSISEQSSDIRKAPPTALNVNGSIFTIREAIPEEYKWMKAVNWQGLTDCKTKQIIYVPDASDLKNTLWHEVYHAALCVHDPTYFNNDKKDYILHHPGIYNLAEFMENFSKSNPDFLRWEANNE